MSKAVIDKINPIELSQRLIRCPSVTPDEGGALDELQNVLEELGFRCQRLLFSESGTPDVDNLYARLGDRGPNFCFAGHSDVVPPGDRDEWGEEPWGESFDPVVKPTGQSASLSLGTVSVSAQIAAGWGQDGWGDENWGQSGITFETIFLLLGPHTLIVA